MTGNVGEKAQAVCFSFIMVMSMIAIGGAAFAGSAAADAPPESPTDSPGELQVSLLNASTGTVNATWGVNTTSGTINITNGTETDTQVADITVSDDSAKAIQYAINNASAENDTVRVGPGTYNGSLSVDANGLTLEAADDASPVVTQDSGTVVDVNADDVTVDGLTVEAGDGTFAVDLDGVSDGAAVTLTNNTIDLTAGNDGSDGMKAC